MIRCSVCRHFCYANCSPEDRLGTCHLHPPQYVGMGGSHVETDWQFPVVRDSQGCAEGEMVDPDG